MTDRELKQVLKAVYEPPAPQRKQRFLSKLDALEHRPLSNLQFLAVQAHYLSRWSVLLSAGILMLSLFTVQLSDVRSIWVLSSLLPFVALATVAQVNLSATYHMEELEQATRFSLKAVLLARMGILGIGNALLLLAMGVLHSVTGLLTPMQNVFCLLTPYLLTVFLCLTIVRRWHCAENGYLCGAVSGLVSICCLITGIEYESTIFFLDPALSLLVIVVLLVSTTYQATTYLNTEELAWN